MPKFPGDPRNGTAYQKAVTDMLANSDLCHLCNHRGAKTADHIISVKDWLALYGSFDGVNNPSNMRPAHGVMGKALNKCPTCGKLCNQVKGPGRKPHIPEPRSRNW